MSTRSNSSDVLQHVKGNAKTVLGPGFWDVRYVGRVEAGWKQDRLEPRILAISKFRVFLVAGKSASKVSQETSLHLLSFRSLEVASDSELRLGLEDGRRLFLRVGEEETALGLGRFFLAALRHYFPSSPDFLPALLDCRDEGLRRDWVALRPSRPSLPCADFRRTYAALCDANRLPFRDEVGWDVDKIYASHSIHTLRLDDFSHLYQKDLIPILGVLQFNPWFSGLHIENFKLSAELQDVIEAVARRSIWLKSLVLRNCGLKGEFLGKLGAALKDNEGIRLEELDLRGNYADDGKAAGGLGLGLATAGVSLQRLSLAEMGLHSKALSPILAALFRAQLSGTRLTSLLLPHNTITDSADLFHLLAHSVHLAELDISHCGLPLEKLWSNLKVGGLQLRRLALSGCVLGSAKKSQRDVAPPGLKDFFASSVALAELDLSEANVAGEVLKALLLGLASNTQISGLSLDLSRLCSDRALIPVLETSLPKIPALASLSLRDNGLDAELGRLLSALASAPSLRSLDVGGNNLSGLLRKTGKQLPPVLLDLVRLLSDEESRLRELSLADAKLGVHISVLLNALGPAPALQVLDVSGNDMGDMGARLLAKALQVNSALTTLRIDRNRVTADGFADIAHALKHNRQITWIPYPVMDAAEAMGKGEKEKITTVLGQMEEMVRENARRAAETEAPSTEPQLALSSLIEELNRAILSCQRSMGSTATAANPIVDDAEKAKQMVQNFESFIPKDDEARNIASDADSLFKLLVERSIKTMESSVESEVGLDALSAAQEKDALMRTLSGPGVGGTIPERHQRLCRRFLRGLLEAHLLRLIAKLGSLSTSSSGLVTIQDASLVMVNSWDPNSSVPATPPTPSRTPRGKDKWESRNSRPKSIVDGGPGTPELDPDSDCPDSEQSSSHASPVPSADPRALTDLLKTRARPGPGRRRATRPPNSALAHTPIAAGLNDFFVPPQATETPRSEDRNGNHTTEEEPLGPLPVSSPLVLPDEPVEEKPKRLPPAVLSKKPLLPPLPTKPKPTGPPSPSIPPPPTVPPTAVTPPPPPVVPPPPMPSPSQIQALLRPEPPEDRTRKSVSWNAEPPSVIGATADVTPEEFEAKVRLRVASARDSHKSSIDSNGSGEEGGAGDRKSVSDLLSAFERRGQRIAPSE